MKHSHKIQISGDTQKPRISRQLYVQVEERINLRRARFTAPWLIDLGTMARKALEREKMDHES